MIDEIVNNLQRIADRKCYPEDILDGSIAQEWVDYLTNLEQENKQLKETIKEATRILNSAKNHYGNDGKNWALERVIDLLGDKGNEY